MLVRGLEKIWVIGDEFCYNTYDHYFKHTNPDGSNDSFAFLNFEMRDFFSDDFTSHNCSVAGRIINNLINALYEHSTLPKLIVMVLDNDIVKKNIPDSANMFDKIRGITKWLLKECQKAIDIYKDFLLIKSKRDTVLQFLWIAPPTHKYFHDNKKREMQSSALHQEVKYFEHMVALNMIKFWDSTDSKNFIYEANRFTAEGFIRYWLSIDVAIRYWNTAIFPKIGKM